MKASASCLSPSKIVGPIRRCLRSAATGTGTSWAGGAAGGPPPGASGPSPPRLPGLPGPPGPPPGGTHRRAVLRVALILSLSACVIAGGAGGVPVAAAGAVVVDIVRLVVVVVTAIVPISVGCGWQIVLVLRPVGIAVAVCCMGVMSGAQGSLSVRCVLPGLLGSI